MKSIQMKYKDFYDKTVIKTFYVNNDGTGLFVNNGLTQWAGTCQFYVATSAELAMKIRKWSEEYKSARMVRNSAEGW
jgi:hypothetical protein